MNIYGISSKIPSFFMPKRKRHWFMADIDIKKLGDFTQSFHTALTALQITGEPCNDTPFMMYPTPHGYHIIIFTPLKFRDLYDILGIIPHVDLSWKTIGFRRGYWFLWNRDPKVYPLPVTYMKLKVKSGDKWFASKSQL